MPYDKALDQPTHCGKLGPIAFAVETEFSGVVGAHSAPFLPIGSASWRRCCEGELNPLRITGLSSSLARGMQTHQQVSKLGRLSRKGSRPNFFKLDLSARAGQGRRALC